MQTLPAALAGLLRYPQFVLYKLVPSKRKPGKFDKIPLRSDGYGAATTDPADWCSFDEASRALAAGMGQGIGFVFTDSDPFFFLDIDGALIPTKAAVPEHWIDGALIPAQDEVPAHWSPLSQQLCAAFPGAAVEVSSSGKGLHVIGVGAAAAPEGHRCRNPDLSLEFYTTGRFVALTGSQATGSVDADLSHVVPWLLQYFMPAAPEKSEHGVDGWTYEPRADWVGPVDDDELIRRAINSKSMASVFGTKAVFADLWRCNTDVLARSYPPDAGSTQSYNASDADAALASHLAFWTGCDMERMRSLMLQSLMVRDKWEDPRPGGTWLDMTIRNAVAAQRDVCKDKARPEAPSGPATPVPPTTPDQGSAPTPERAGNAILRPGNQRRLFEGCYYVLDAHRVLLPNGMLIKPDQFKTRYGGRVFLLDNANEKTTRNAWEAFTESNVNVCPQADSSWFRPVMLPGALTVREGRSYVNTYTPADTESRPGDVTPFLTHLAKVLPVERDRLILLSYMAACVQHIGIKFQWAPLLQGAEGNGKSLFSRCVAHAVGERYTHWPRADQISAKFNSWLLGRLFIGVEDMYLPEDRGEVFEILKPMITNDRQSVEPKGVDQQSLWVCCNFILNSNHKDAIKKSRGDRRIAPLYCAQQQDNPDDVAWIADHGMGGDYFPKLYAWLKEQGGYAIVTHFLQNYAIAEEFNPATHCSRAPITSSTEEAIKQGLGKIEQEIFEAIAAEESGFRGGWISSFALKKLAEKIGRSRFMTPRKYDELMSSLGYIKHTGLANGRVDNIVLPDSGKPVLYVRKGAPMLELTKPADIARAYTVAQTTQ